MSLTVFFETEIYRGIIIKVNNDERKHTEKHIHIINTKAEKNRRKTRVIYPYLKPIGNDRALTGNEIKIVKEIIGKNKDKIEEALSKQVVQNIRKFINLIETQSKINIGIIYNKNTNKIRIILKIKDSDGNKIKIKTLNVPKNIYMTMNAIKELIVRISNE